MYNLARCGAEVTSFAFPLKLESALGNNLTLYLWDVDPDFLSWGFLEIQNKDSNTAMGVLNLCKELKVILNYLSFFLPPLIPHPHPPSSNTEVCQLCHLLMCHEIP